MSGRQFERWKAVYRNMPWSDEWNIAAKICATIRRTAGQEAEEKDYLPYFESVQPVDQQQVDDANWNVIMRMAGQR